MKILPCIFLILLISCNKQSEQISKEDECKKTIEKEKYYTKEDSIFIITKYDTFKYGKSDYNKIIDSNPEFLDEFPEDPYILYDCKVNYMEYGSEVGKDSYFVLYQHFVQQRNGIKEYEHERQTLIDIYSKINDLFATLEYGGTYFGHQYFRILGYAEYSVYLYKSNIEDIDKSHSIVKQKELYIKSLYQLIEDRVEIDTELIDINEKNIQLKELNKIVNDLDKLITNIFYLRRVQEFQYRFYEYYL